MSTDLRKIQTESPVAEGRTAAPAVKPALREVVAEVLTDSQARPAEYLDEVVVPKGGE